MIIISPSKNLNLSNEVYESSTTAPDFANETKSLINKIKKLEVDDIKSIMKISENLAKLNYDRFKDINKKHNITKPAAFLFSGDTFNGLLIRSMDKESLSYAQKNSEFCQDFMGF